MNPCCVSCNTTSIQKLWKSVWCFYLVDGCKNRKCDGGDSNFIWRHVSTKWNADQPNAIWSRRHKFTDWLQKYGYQILFPVQLYNWCMCQQDVMCRGVPFRTVSKWGRAAVRGYDSKFIALPSFTVKSRKHTSAKYVSLLCIDIVTLSITAYFGISGGHVAQD